MSTTTKSSSLLEERILSRLEDPLLVFDAKGIVWYGNENFWKFSGYKKDEVLKKNIGVFLPSQGKERVLGALSRVIVKKTILQDFHASLLTKRGKIIPISFYAASLAGAKKGFATISDMRQLQGLLEGLRHAQKSLQERVKERTRELEVKTHDLEDTQKALLNMLEDIQEARKRAEVEKNKTSAIISGLVDGLLLLSGGGAVELINPAGENLLDVRERDIKGKKISDFPQNLFLAHFAKLLEDKKPGEELFRKEIHVPEKEDRSLEVTSIALPENSQILFILHDITREKKVERLKTEFVSLSAHQLRTPLSAIKWTIRMLLDEEMGPLNKEQKEFLDKVYASNERMIELINDLLDVTRIEEGRYLYRPEFSQIEELVKTVVQLNQGEAKQRNVVLIFQSPAQKLSRVFVDEEKIKIAVQNIIDNALRYTLAGGKIVVSFSQNANEVVVSVQDSGIGIPQAQQGQVFERFFRASNAKRIETAGSGLGLFISKNIVQAHGGGISFASEEGKGTTFTFSLPVKQEIEEFLKKF